MKAITEVDSKKLKDSATKLNSSGLLSEKIRTVGVSKQALCEAFVDAIDSLEDELREQLSTTLTEVVEFYNDLIADEAEEEPEEAEAIEQTEPEPAPAPAARASRKKAAPEAPSPEPAPKPKKAAKAEEAAPAKTKKADKPAKTEEPAAPTTVAEAAAKKKRVFPGQGERTVLGHVKGTMAGTIDEMLLEGVTEETAVKKLQKEYGRDYGHAVNKFKGHVNYLKKTRNFTVTKDDNGIMKVDDPTAAAAAPAAPAAKPKKKAS